tara:strand:+ start:116376 stop:117023 length:648 start_codon:yes stop_codon:yes gene_type:complete
MNFSRLNNPKFLQAYYPLSKDDLDYSGHGRHGTSTDLTFEEGSIRGKNVGSFNGSSSRVDNPFLNLLDSMVFSISGWYIPSSTGELCIFSEGDSITTSIPHLEIYTFNRKLNASLRDDASTSGNVLNLGSIKNNSFNHFTYVSNGYSSRFLTHNNKDTSSNSTTLSTISTNVSAIGVLFRTSSVSFFNGQISNFRIYNCALTAEEISTLYYLERK